MRLLVRTFAACLLAFAIGFAVMAPITAFTPLTDVYFYLDAASQLVVDASAKVHGI